MRWFVVRVVALVALLGIPILGTAYALVSSVSADIAMADVEHAELVAFERVIDVVPLVEAVHRDREIGDAAAERHDRAAVEAAFVRGERAYVRLRALPHARGEWRQWHAAWHDGIADPAPSATGHALDELERIGNALDADSPLDVDPSFAVQNLVSAALRQIPRSIVAIRRTADDLADADGPILTRAAIRRISASRALEIGPLQRLYGDVPFVLTLEPRLRPAVAPALQAVRRETDAFETGVDGSLDTFVRRSIDAAHVERSARRAIDAHVALWRAARAQSDGLIVRRRERGIVRRRVIIALAVLAVLVGTLAITLVGRHMARGDRVALHAAKLESDTLRSKLLQVTIERALRLQEAQFRSVFENADLGIAIFQLNGAVAQYNAAAASILGDNLDRVLTGRIPQIAAVCAEHAPFTLEEAHPRADGSLQWLALTFSGVYDEDRCEMVILLLRDTTEEKLLQASLIYAASHDGLTQIANRSAFEQRLETLFADPAEAFALMYVDLDKFKPVNDAFGHAAGDHVLVATADRLRSALGADDFCARLGGDEFAAIVRGPVTRATLESIAARIAAAIGAPLAYGAHELTVSASIGIAIRGRDHRTGLDLKADADRALYSVKGNPARPFAIAESREPVGAAPV